jgi:hypothetical protein
MGAGMVADFATGVFLLAILYVLVRPGSKGAEMINGFGAAMKGIVTAATDL